MAALPRRLPVVPSATVAELPQALASAAKEKRIPQDLMRTIDVAVCGKLDGR
jgi:hypothetical protein